MVDFVEDAIACESEFEKLEEREKNVTVKEAVMELPEHYRDVILCVYLNEMSLQDTSKSLGIPVGTVKSRLRRAKDKLKDLLERRL